MRLTCPESARFEVSHPWHKNKNVPGMGHPGVLALQHPGHWGAMECDGERESEMCGGAYCKGVERGGKF